MNNAKIVQEEINWLKKKTIKIARQLGLDIANTSTDDLLKELIYKRRIDPYDTVFDFETREFDGETYLAIRFPRFYEGSPHWDKDWTWDDIQVDIINNLGGRYSVYTQRFEVPVQYASDIKNRIYARLAMNDALDLLP